MEGLYRCAAFTALFFAAPVALAQVELSVDALRKCAEAGVPECQFRYARRLDSGDGVPADREAAKRLYEQAYSAGYSPAGPALLELLHRPGDDTQDAGSHRARRVIPDMQEESPSIQAGGQGEGKQPGLVSECVSRVESPASCLISIKAGALPPDGRHLKIALSVGNHGSARVYISRGLIRVFQGSYQLTVLNSTEATPSGRAASRGRRALRSLPNFTGWGRPRPATTVARNLAGTALKSASRATPLPTGPEGYLTSGYVAPGATFNGFFVAELMDAVTPVTLEIEIADERVRLQIPLMQD